MNTTFWPAIRGIVFDLDDTLYAQREFKLSGFHALADWLHQHHGCDTQTVLDELVAAMDHLGASHPQLIDTAVDAVGLDRSDVPLLVDVFRRHRPAIALHAGVGALLRQLRAHCRLGLLTDGMAAVQRNKIAALGLADAFDHIVVSDEFGLEKPDIRLYQMLEQALHLAPGQLLYVGDNPAKDFVGARQRGWHTLRVLSGEHAASMAPSAAHDADLQIAGVSDLADLLAQRKEVQA